MTKLIFLGSGSAFTICNSNFQSNMLLVNDEGNKLLIDCGSDIRLSLHQAGFSYLDITDIYVSHTHGDHVGGLEYIGFSSKFDPNCNKPKLYLSQEIVGDLWHHTLSGAMRSIEDEIATLETFFEVFPIKRDTNFLWENIDFYLVKVVHVNNGYFVLPCYGLFFEVNRTKIFLTTDTQLCLDRLEKFYEEADIIFQDCETSIFPSKIHAHYQQLLTLPDHIRKKMWLYHYQGGALPDAKSDGFQGFVKRGQIFEFVGGSVLTSDEILETEVRSK
jgi:ribonuclease BN (tRNA processing enzyme)